MPSSSKQSSLYKRQGSGTKLEEIIRTSGVDDVLFNLLSDENGNVALSQFWADIKSTGLSLDDPRLKECRKNFEEIERKNATEEGASVTVDRSTFKRCIAENLNLIIKAFKQDLIIPEFSNFTEHVELLCGKCKENNDGKVADYIPQLARVSPDLWAVSICTTDGQRYSYGDSDAHFSLQAVSKPINYALATSDVGAALVHDYVGQEPSGEASNKLALDHNNKPHNPLINSGAMVTNCLIKPKLLIADKFDFVFKEYRRLAGNEYIGFSNSIYLAEKNNADRNFAIGHYMREGKCFPSNTDLMKTLEFYFQMCSIEATTESASVIAATLANGGICPITGEKILALEAVRNTLSLMYSCGMSDYSGQFAFKVGLPAKSSLAGAVLVVVPNVMGICCFSPPLDSTGISCRGLQFCKEFVNVFNFHNYDYLTNSTEKLDPRKRGDDKEVNNCINLLSSAAAGDVTAVKRFYMSGMDMMAADYDSRTALHVAAAEGHLNVAMALLELCKVDPNPKDRWGHTPFDDALRFGHDEVASYIENFDRNIQCGERYMSEKASSGYSSKSTSPGPEMNFKR